MTDSEYRDFLFEIKTASLDACDRGLFHIADVLDMALDYIKELTEELENARD